MQGGVVCSLQVDLTLGLILTAESRGSFGSSELFCPAKQATYRLRHSPPPKSGVEARSLTLSLFQMLEGTRDLLTNNPSGDRQLSIGRLQTRSKQKSNISQLDPSQGVVHCNVLGAYSYLDLDRETPTLSPRALALKAETFGHW